MPIESNIKDLPAELTDFISLESVNFILKIRPEIDHKAVKKKIAVLFKDEQILLFLPHTRSVDLQYFDSRDKQMKYYRKIIREQKKEIFSLSRYEGHELKSISEWRISHFEAPIPENISRSVENLDKRQCPEKLDAK